MRRLLLALALFAAAGCSSGNVTTTLGRQHVTPDTPVPHAELAPALTETQPAVVCWVELETGGESGIYGGDPSDAPTGPTFVRWTVCPTGPFTP